MRVQEQGSRFPVHGWVGGGLVAVFWVLNWGLEGFRTQWGFFPLWLGYALLVDGIVELRKGSSLLTRSPKAYASLFVFSAPVWWLFELINARTDNWVYQGREYFSDLEYGILATISFSTVMPAVFSTAELVGTLGFVRRMKDGWMLDRSKGVRNGLFITGWTMLGLILWQPEYFFPLVWGAVFAIVEPFNLARGYPSLLVWTAKRDWRPVVALSLGALICGFFWEMWNYYSYPRWVYRVPYVGVWHVFEMPLLGFIGYLPFAWELFTVYHFLAGMLRMKAPYDVGREILFKV